MSSNYGGEVSSVRLQSKSISTGYEIVRMGIRVAGQSQTVAGGSGEVVASKNANLGTLQGVSKSRASGYGSLPPLICGNSHQNEKDTRKEEEERSLEYKHSEDDGSDDESGKKFASSRNIVSNQVTTDWGNPFVMNSSVAFGENDWDDFVQETGANVGVPLIWDRSHEPTEKNLGSERNLFSVSPVQGMDVQALNLMMSEEQVEDTDLGVGNRSNQPRSPVKSAEQVFADESEEYLDSCSITNVFEMDGAAIEKTQLEVKPGVDANGCSKEEADYPSLDSEELSSFNNKKLLENRELESCGVNLDSLSGSNSNQLTHHPGTPVKIEAELFEDGFPNSLAFNMLETKVTSESNSSLLSQALDKDNISSTKSDSIEPNGFIADVLHEMEEILLDSAESPGAIASHDKKVSGLTPSTSGTDNGDSFVRHTLKIDGVEVTGAKQKKGSVSLSERLVGVKEYTVYMIRVSSGNHHWEVERRYRDFLTLYRRLKSFFAEQGLDLPSEWSSVERESSKIFGSASPDVVSERSRLIEDCLHSVLHSKFFFKPPDALLWFLFPFVTEGTDNGENISTLGNTISLIVENRPYISMKQMLETQHYCCAGCRSHFDDRMSLMRDLVQKFGWGKPRLCEYTGQLFCSSCHTNETAVLPSRVLHSWDFTEYPVCQLAKSYLDSIHDKPLLCVSAVNPLLFGKVPGLFHVTCARKKIGSMLPFVRCPFCISIDKGLGSRRYLIESNDFFALRDLIDLSRGAFAALPTMLETVSRKILEHLTEQCLICCDVGVPCGAKQACRDPSSLIFPFQEDEIGRCGSCNAVFHKQCFKRLGKCHCQVNVETNEVVDGSNSVNEPDGALNLLVRRSSGLPLPSRLLSRLFPKSKSDFTEDLRVVDDTVLLMGSLPSTSIHNL